MNNTITQIERKYLFSDLSSVGPVGQANQPDDEAHLYYDELNRCRERRQTWAGVAVWLAIVCPTLAFCIHVTPLS
jgi:hypothetical protein